jgi:uncharacterized membrane protein
MNARSQIGIQNADDRSMWIVALALLAMAAKLAIAYNTIGTNDAVFFYGFAKVLNQHGLQWTYAHSRYFNHPPLTAYFLQGIYLLTEQSWAQNLGIHFPFLLRFPGIIADFIVVLVLMQFRANGVAIPGWALILFAASPVSLMVTGFHGNTDPVMVLLCVSSAWMCLRKQPIAAGLFFALGCQIKIVPLLLLPTFTFYWLSQRQLVRFALPAGLTTCLLWSQPLFTFPGLFAKNVLAYGSYWGTWGITYCLRLSGRPELSRLSFFDLTTAQNLIVAVLKMVIICSALWIAWQHRSSRGRGFIEGIGYTWLVFFLFAPGVGAQYLIWLAPFLLVLSPVFYTCVMVASSIFLFEFYNITSGGLPWSVALAMDDSKQHWIAWSILPWLVLIAGSLLLWRNAQPALAWRPTSLQSAENA